MSLIAKFKRYRENNKRRAAKNGQPTSETSENAEMSFLDHLEELRWHLVRSLIAIGVVAVAIFVNIQWFTNRIVLAPFSVDFPLNRVLCKLLGSCDPVQVKTVAYAPFEQFLLSLKLSFIGGFVVMFPYVLWEVWRFVRPGLHKAERNRFRGVVGALSFLFFVGVAFGYYIVTPFSIQFLANFQISEAIANEWRIGSTISVLVQIPLATGIMFELPMIVWALSKLGLLTPEIMKAYRRHAIVILLVVSAILTPPDVTSQILIFLPLLLLYEFSVIICRRVNLKRERELLGEASS